MMGTPRALRDATAGFSIDRISLLVLIAAGLGALGIIGVRLYDATMVAPLSYNEGWNAYHALRFLETGSPYPPAGGLVMNNYTPIWFPLVAWMGFATGSLVMAGRVVATLGFFSVLICATLIGATLRGRWGAMAAFVTTSFVLAAEAQLYIGIADPQFVAQGLAAFALLLAVRATSTRDSRFLAAMAVSVLAGFMKYNLAALPLALFVAALFEGRDSVVRVMLVALVATVVCYLLCALAGGLSWPLQLLSARVYSVSRLISRSTPFITDNVLGLLLAFVGLRTLPRGHVQRILTVYIVCAVPLAVFFVGGEGVSVNIFFDALIAMAVSASLVVGARPAVREAGAVNNWEFTLPAWGTTVLLGAFLFVIGFPQMLGTAIRVRHPEDFNERATAFREDLAFLKSIPGNAICYDMDLCYLAGKPLIYDPFNATQALLTGAVSAERARELLRADQVQVIHASTATEAWDVPKPIAAEVAAQFDVARTNINGVFYVRRERRASP